MITNITKDLKVCGIYKINYDNRKIYIGQALSIWSRAHEHNSKNIENCDKALKKHNASIEILEKVEDITLLDQIESKWIEYFNATDKNIGYNVLKEGNASGKKGVDNLNAALNIDQLTQIIDLLINRPDLSYKDIATLFGVSSNTIYNISNGYRYVNLNLTYPLRSNNHESCRKNKVKDYFKNENVLLELKEDLLYRWDLEIETDLVQKYNIPLKIIRDINSGKLFQEYGKYFYPIRKKNIRNNQNFTLLDVENILSDLRNTKLSMTKIGEKYNIHRDTVSKINQGKSYIIKNYQYPAR